jgi:transposase InsO family protein
VLVELGVVEQRYRAVLEVLEDSAGVTDVARRYGVARQTVHEWLSRYAKGGLGGLADRSSRPASCPHQMPAEVEARIAGMRREHPGWGPSRIRWELERAGTVPLPGRPAVYRALIRHGLADPKKRRRRREDYRRWERGRAMQLWQMDVMGRVFLAGGQEVKVVTGIDDHSRFVVCAQVVVRAAARPVCQALAGALARHGVPEQILTGNGKVFTARFGRGPGPVLFDRICADNGIRHLLTAPYSPATTGKVGRLHKTMRAEFFTPNDRMSATAEELQAALDGWVRQYSTTRPHQSCGGRPPIERFRLADRSITPDDSAVVPEPVAAKGGSGETAGRSAAVGERARQDLPGRVLLPRRGHVRRRAGRGRRAGRPGGHPARRRRGRHLRAAVPPGPGRPGAAGPRHPPRARCHRRGERDQAGRRGRGGQLRRNPVRGRAPPGAHRHRRGHRGRVGAAVQRRPGHPRAPGPPRPRP